MTKRMKLRAKPKRPRENATVAKIHMVESGETLSDILDSLSCSLEEALGIEFNAGYDRLTARLEISESDSMRTDRMKVYERKLALYDKWYKENRAEIDAELSFRREEKVRKKTIEREILRLRKQL